MRAIDADALQLAIVEEGQANKRKKYIIGDVWELTGAEIREVINSQPTIQPEPHWIPVTERLPNKEEKSYWVCLEGGGQCQCRWTNDVYGLGANEWSKWGWKKVDLPQYSKVVAYMPLPEPYEGVTE